jgi:predicted nucleic acid-binding protein
MILTDAGPLVAIVDRGDPNHARSVEALSGLSPPLVTTWPALTEAMYLVHQALGWSGQAALWEMVERRDLHIVELTPDLAGRMRTLMEQYRDLPMDLADASLVAVSEERRLDRVFTLDSDFRVYRLPRGRSFTTIP